jgi:hypothetical protein
MSREELITRARFVPVIAFWPAPTRLPLRHSMPARTIWRVRDAGSKAPVWKPNQAQLGAKRAGVAQMQAFY